MISRKPSIDLLKAQKESIIVETFGMMFHNFAPCTGNETSYSDCNLEEHRGRGRTTALMWSSRLINSSSTSFGALPWSIFPHVEDGVPFTSSLKGEQLQFLQSFPVVEVLKTVDLRSERTLDIFQCSDVCQLVGDP